MNWSGLVIGIESACILLFVVMLIGSLVTERGKELMFHGFIAGLVGVGLVVFDFGVRFLLLQKPEDAPLWAIILAVFGVFIAIFAAVVCLDAVLEQRSVPLESVGVIDGDYVDVVFDDGGKMTSASTINISSTKRSGFAIRGTAYDPASLQEKGKFDGTGAVSGSDGLCYSYYGHEDITPDHGVCYYRFSKDPQKSITFFGGFVAFGLRTSHRVRGRKIRDRERAEFDRDGANPSSSNT